MAPDRTVVQRGEERSLLTAEEEGANPMKLARLEFTQHPRTPQHELRQRGVFDSGARLIGHVENIYVDDEGTFRFLDVAMGRFMGIGKKHHLVPVEAIAEEEPGSSITLTLDQQTVLQSAPTLGDPYTVPDEGLQRAARQSGAENSGRWGAWQ
jgi:PRC-barrel domain